MNCPDCDSDSFKPYTNPHSKVTRTYCRKCGYGLNEISNRTAYKFKVFDKNNKTLYTSDECSNKVSAEYELQKYSFANKKAVSAYLFEVGRKPNEVASLIREIIKVQNTNNLSTSENEMVDEARTILEQFAECEVVNI